MIKPFIVDGHHFDGELLEKMEKNELTKINIQRRVHYQKWTPEEAVSVKKGEKRPPRKTKRKPLLNPANGPVKTYFLSPEELTEYRRKYGEPGITMSKEKAPVAVRGVNRR